MNKSNLSRRLAAAGIAAAAFGAPAAIFAAEEETEIPVQDLETSGSEDSNQAAEPGSASGQPQETAAPQASAADEETVSDQQDPSMTADGSADQGMDSALQDDAADTDPAKEQTETVQDADDPAKEQNNQPDQTAAVPDSADVETLNDQTELQSASQTEPAAVIDTSTSNEDALKMLTSADQNTYELKGGSSMEEALRILFSSNPTIQNKVLIINGYVIFDSGNTVIYGSNLILQGKTGKDTDFLFINPVKDGESLDVGSDDMSKVPQVEYLSGVPEAARKENPQTIKMLGTVDNHESLKMSNLSYGNRMHLIYTDLVIDGDVDFLADDQFINSNLFMRGGSIKGATSEQIDHLNLTNGLYVYHASQNQTFSITNLTIHAGAGIETNFVRDYLSQTSGCILLNCYGSSGSTSQLLLDHVDFTSDPSNYAGISARAQKLGLRPFYSGGISTFADNTSFGGATITNSRFTALKSSDYSYHEILLGATSKDFIVDNCTFTCTDNSGIQFYKFFNKGQLKITNTDISISNSIENLSSGLLITSQGTIEYSSTGDTRNTINLSGYVRSISAQAVGNSKGEEDTTLSISGTDITMDALPLSNGFTQDMEVSIYRGIASLSDCVINLKGATTDLVFTPVTKDHKTYLTNTQIYVGGKIYNGLSYENRLMQVYLKANPDGSNTNRIYVNVPSDIPDGYASILYNMNTYQSASQPTTIQLIMDGGSLYASKEAEFANYLYPDYTSTVTADPQNLQSILYAPTPTVVAEDGTRLNQFYISKNSTDRYQIDENGNPYIDYVDSRGNTIHYVFSFDENGDAWVWLEAVPVIYDENGGVFDDLGTAEKDTDSRSVNYQKTGDVTVASMSLKDQNRAVPTVSRDGYKFKGWTLIDADGNTDGKLYTSDELETMNIPSSMTAQAQWEQLWTVTVNVSTPDGEKTGSFTEVLDPDNGNISMDQLNALIPSGYKLPDHFSPAVDPATVQDGKAEVSITLDYVMWTVTVEYTALDENGQPVTISKDNVQIRAIDPYITEEQLRAGLPAGYTLAENFMDNITYGDTDRKAENTDLGIRIDADMVMDEKSTVKVPVVQNKPAKPETSDQENSQKPDQKKESAAKTLQSSMETTGSVPTGLFMGIAGWISTAGASLAGALGLSRKRRKH